MRGTLLSVATMALFAMPAHAQTWESLGSSTDGTSFSVDTQTMKTGPGGGTEVWIRQIHKKPQRVFPSQKAPLFLVVLNRTTFHCGDFAMSVGYTVYRDGNGNSVHTDPRQGDPSPVVPGSMGQAAYERVCPPN